MGESESGNREDALERVADERDRTADERDRIADEREQSADERDCVRTNASVRRRSVSLSDYNGWTTRKSASTPLLSGRTPR